MVTFLARANKGPLSNDGLRAMFAEVLARDEAGARAEGVGAGDARRDGAAAPTSRRPVASQLQGLLRLSPSARRAA